MTLAKRVIATLVMDGARGVMVRGRGWARDRVVGEPVQWARIMTGLRDVDEIVVLDYSDSAPHFDLLDRITEVCFVPIAYGGGIATVDLGLEALRCGADKLVVHSMPLIAALSQCVGAQSVVAVTETPDATIAARQALAGVVAGAGELLIQNRERDGTCSGYDLVLARAVCSVVDVPIILSSGAGSSEDFLAGFRAGAQACAAGAVWQFTDLRPAQVKAAMAATGIPVRPPERAL